MSLIALAFMLLGLAVSVRFALNKLIDWTSLPKADSFTKQEPTLALASEEEPKEAKKAPSAEKTAERVASTSPQKSKKKQTTDRSVSAYLRKKERELENLTFNM